MEYIPTLKGWLIPILVPSMMASTRNAAAQGHYALTAGNLWEYWQDSYYGWTTQSLRDTLMPNGIQYTSLVKDASLGYTGYFRQDSAQVYEFSAPLQEDRLKYDFSKTQGDTVFIRTDSSNEMTVMTVLYEGYANVFGTLRHQWGFYEQHPPSTFYILYEITDSIGLTFLEFEGGSTWFLKGAIIDSVEYGTITSVGKPSPVPSTLALLQNYPNPFNPSTTIQYSLPQRSHVTLKMFTALGQEIVTLVDEEQEAGSHNVAFLPTGLASSTYFYRLEVCGHVEVRKLVLVK